jgi:hypothetical protein
MAKYVNAPIAGASINGTIVVVTLAQFVGGTDMAYSIAIDARKAGKKVALVTTTDLSYIDDWLDDESPEVIVHDGPVKSYAGKTVVVISDKSLSAGQLVYEGAIMVIGVVSSNIVMNTDAFRLEQSNRALLNELEKLLPAESPVRALRDELRKRIFS